MTVLTFPELLSSLKDVAASKRSLYNFAEMVMCGTKRRGLDYYGYGCWCGLGGHGRPVDDLDWYMHTHIAAHALLLFE